MTDTIERLKPVNRAEWLALRKNDITASQISALVGAHPYCTVYQLWATKTGKLAPDDDLDSPAMRRGRLLESVAATCARELLPNALLVDNNGTGAAPHYWRMPEKRIGATPDLLATDKRGFGVIQLKSVEPRVYGRTWHDGEPPLWIGLQALCEAKLTGATWAMVGALRVGHACDFDLTDIPLHEGAWRRLQEAVEEFWHYVETDTPPEPDYARDHEVIRAMHMVSVPESSIDLSGDNELIAALHERERVKGRLKELDDQNKTLDALIRHKVGDYESALAGDFKISLRTQEIAGYTVKPRTQRSIRIKHIGKEIQS